MKKFTDGRLYNVGRELKRRHPNLIWIEIENSFEFISFCKKHYIEDEQIEFIHIGFKEKPFPGAKKTEGIFPFGIHKDKPMNKVPLEYYAWVMKQEWLEKWPTVKAYIEEHKDEITQGKQEYDSALKELSQLKHSLF